MFTNSEPVVPPPAPKLRTDVTVSPIGVTGTIDVGSRQEDNAALGTGAELGDGSSIARHRRGGVSV